MTWEVEVFRWDIQEGRDAQPGRVRFEGLEEVEALHDLSGGFGMGEVDWEVLRSEFRRFNGRIRRVFMLTLPQLRNALGGPDMPSLS
ncbi:hypothetical protein [Deinococcus apachensis]|uniref:hypothetical protein n=1 Tax=Deinococcus apachensis TaxID=309886 RepID=UPI0003653FF8|nr:hypothetical protein [Deinococcus apachensis]